MDASQVEGRSYTLLRHRHTMQGITTASQEATLAWSSKAIIHGST